jgi:hypothetical protein
LPETLSAYKHILVVVRVPPFKEACGYAGGISDDNDLPHFACRSVGDVLREVALSCPDHPFTVLCGHTQGPGGARIRENREVHIAGAEYGKPVVQRILACD